MEEPKPLRDAITEIAGRIDELEKEKKHKKFKLPFSAKLSKGKVKKNWVSVMYILENKEVKFTRVPIDEQVAEVNGQPYYIPSDQIMTFRSKPLVVLPSWSITAFSPSEHYKETMKNPLYASKGWKYIINFVNKTQIKAKREIKMGAILLGCLVVGGIIWYAIKSGAFT